MSRITCNKCHRPQKTCICQFTIPIDNQCLVIVLLHPNEAKQAKGTLPLLTGSLKNMVVFQGENFSDHNEFNKILMSFGEQVALLYPSEQALEVPLFGGEAVHKTDIKCLILLDATWKKAFKMYKLSTNLHHIRHLALPEQCLGQYHIRKTNKKNALSTLEACCYALEMLELPSANNYQLLIDKFVKFNNFQLSFRGLKSNT